MWKTLHNFISSVEKSINLSTRKSTNRSNFCTYFFHFKQNFGKFILNFFAYNKTLRFFKNRRTKYKAPNKQKLNLCTNAQHLLQKLLNINIKLVFETLSEKLIIALFITLPWNLGKHFELKISYINGFLVPYLIPTIYVQDLIILFILALNVAQNKAKKYQNNYLVSQRFLELERKIFYLFLICLFFSTAFSERFLASFYFFLRVFLYVMFFSLCVYYFNMPKIRKGFLTASLFNFVFLIFLGIFQFVRQSSFFNNYIFMGEQPYNANTFNIVKESYGGVSKVPPYGLFSHPNIFAGYLLVFIILFSGLLFKKDFGNFKAKVILFFILLLGGWVLFLTKSFSAIICLILFLFYLLFWVLLRYKVRDKVKKFWLAVFLLVSIILAFNYIYSYSLGVNYKSLYRRASLLRVSYLMFLEHPFFGVGVNSFTYKHLEFYQDEFSIRFFEPVHNVFMLILAEAGIFAFAFYLCVFILSFWFLFVSFRHLKPLNIFYAFAILAIFLLSNFDHYFFTIHQTFLIFILTLMLGLTYTKSTKAL